MPPSRRHSACAALGLGTLPSTYTGSSCQANHVHAGHGFAPLTSTIDVASHAWPRLRATWGILHAQLQHPTMFLSEAWVDCWLTVFGRDASPLLWVARAGDAVVAMALLVRRWERRGPVPVRCLYLNTAGEGADSVTLEHNALLVQPGCEDAAWQALAETLHSLPWDELILAGGDIEAAQRLRHMFAGWPVHLDGRPAPNVPLRAVREQDDGVLGLLSANTRSQLRRAARVASAVAPLSLHEATTPAERSAEWQELSRLHEARWRERGQAGAFARPRWRAFHERLLEVAPQNTRLLQLRVGSDTVAALYVLQFQGHVAFYQSGVKHANGNNREKPGMLLHTMAIDRLAAEGLEEYDFLASDGPEVRYKRSLAMQERVLWWGAVFRPTWRSRLVRALRALRTAVHSALQLAGR